MIVVVLAEDCSNEEDARVIMAIRWGYRGLPYRGIWVHPTPDRPLVHIFGAESEQELEEAGWTREASHE